MSQIDRKAFIEKYLSNKQLRFITYLIVKQNNMKNEDKINFIVDSLKGEKGKLYVIVGAKRHGKSSLMYYLAEQLDNVWWYGPPVKLPPFIKGHTLDMNKIPPNTNILMDEIGLQFFARIRNQSVTDFVRQLPVIGHTSRNLIVCTQSMAVSDLTFFRMADAILFKTYSVFQDQSERFKLSDQLLMFMPNKKNECLYFDNSQILTFNYDLPEWWDEEYSKPYAPFKSKAEYYKFVLCLLQDISDNSKIIEQLALKGRAAEEIDIMNIRMIAEHYGYDTLLKNNNKLMIELIDAGFDDTPINLQINEIYKKLKCNFEFTPIEEEENTKWLQADDTLRLLTMRNINQVFVSDLKYRKNHGFNLICSVYGPSGCLSGSTIIQTPTKQIKLSDIWKNNQHTFSVNSYNFKAKRIEPHIATIINSGTKPIFRITTESGKIIDATKDHKFFVFSNNKIVERQLKSLKIGDKLISTKT